MDRINKYTLSDLKVYFFFIYTGDAYNFKFFIHPNPEKGKRSL